MGMTTKTKAENLHTKACAGRRTAPKLLLAVQSTVFGSEPI